MRSYSSRAVQRATRNVHTLRRNVYSRGMYSIVLVDDHAIVREGFKRLIEMEPDLDVVAECRSADDAVEAVGHWRPDLVALDLSLPDGSGLPLIEHLLSVCRYVERNALRAKMVESAGLWPYGSIAARGLKKPPPWLLPQDRWPVDVPAGWARRLDRPQSPAEEASMRCCFPRDMRKCSRISKKMPRFC